MKNLKKLIDNLLLHSYSFTVHPRLLTVEIECSQMITDSTNDIGLMCENYGATEISVEGFKVTAVFA